MNTKKAKNKQKQHKPPTPQPKPENSELESEKSEQTEQIQKEVQSELLKSEERVPEIVSETVQPILEAKVSESDVPRKPKRNRGKKKKTEKSDEPEEVLDELTLEENKNICEIQEGINTDTIEEKPAETAEVTPVARKKKNKNKKQSEQSEKRAEQEIKIAPINKNEELTDLKIITVVPVSTETFEESKSKKKNKKKKRTDSERSDRTEEVVSCTAAFQKLLESKDVKKDNKQDEQIVLSKDTEQSLSLKAEDTILKKETLIPECIKRDKSTENKNEPKEDSGKGKKKNKKDRKHALKDNSEDEASKPLQTKIEIDSECQTVTGPTDIQMTTDNILKEELLSSKVDIIGSSEPLLEKEKSPKPKAKIVKPVDKKRIEKQDISCIEDLTEKVPEIVSVEGQPKKNTEIHSPIEQKEECNVNVIKTEGISKETHIFDTKITDVNPEENQRNKVQLTETVKDKKRKKSPKPKQSFETKELVDESQLAPKYENKENFCTLQDATLATKEVHTTEIKIESQIKSSDTKQVIKDNEPMPLSFELSTPQKYTQTHILKTPEVTEDKERNLEVKEIMPAKEEVDTEKNIEKERIEVPEAHMGKKRKKSPKPHKKAAKSFETIEQTPSSTDFKKETPQEIKNEENKTAELTTSATEIPIEMSQDQLKTDRLADLPILEDIEICSIKAEESECSDITPEIHYPRASSQMDDNNNTVIRDITAIDEKLHIPNISTDTPLIQDSVETPLSVPNPSHPGVTITEITSTFKQEQAKITESPEKDIKTGEPDLKARVLDVNEGMEQLRRSIERSLAELSSMEKSEKEAEDQFFKAQVKLEQITEMASKKTEEKKQVLEPEIVKEVQEKIVPDQKDQEKEMQQKNNDTEKSIEKTTCILKQEEVGTQPTLQKLPIKPVEEKPIEQKSLENIVFSDTQVPQTPPIPARKDNKGKGKKGKKGKQDFENVCTTTSTALSSSSSTTATTNENKETSQQATKEEKSDQKTESNTQQKEKQQSTQDKGKQQDDASSINDNENNKMFSDSVLTDSVQMDFEPIENFEDALYANIDEKEQDVNKTFEIIANEAIKIDESQNPAINITAPIEDEDNTTNNKKEQEKVNPVSQPKNLLGHPDIPARLNKTDYKKERNKHQTATVKIKDAVPIEVTKESKESQTENKRRFIKDKTVTESITSMTSENEEYIYKYSFRKVFLLSACHVCKKDLKTSRVPCNFCNLIFYCSVKHKDEDYSQHQGLCFAVSTILHLRDQKHIYSDAKNITGHEYRLLRMQMIVSCEKVLKRSLMPWEQEALLYPRICADIGCREWRHNKLMDCESCGQIAYCIDNPTHLPKTHHRWCKSYSLYHKLVVYQQRNGRLEPKLPTRVLSEIQQIPEKLNEVLASLYEEKIDMTDIQYAALTQIATAPLTAAYCHQLYNNKMNTIYANGVLKKSSFTIHVVGAELQFEADALNKWELFFLHLRPDIKDLRIVLVGQDLNPSKLPLDLLAKIKLCDNCHQNKRRVLFEFQDKKSYYDYWSTDFTTPDLVCAFNPSIQRSSIFNGKDNWPSTIRCILKLRIPFIITSYTMSELQNDIARIKECSEVDVNVISEPEFNAFASVRPDRNFISDDEMPLLFKNYCFATVCAF